MMDEIDNLALLNKQIEAIEKEELDVLKRAGELSTRKWELYRLRDTITTEASGYVVGEKLYWTQEYQDAVYTQLPGAILPPFYILAAVSETYLSVYNPFIDKRPFYGYGGTGIPKWQGKHLRRSGEIVEKVPEPEYRD